MCHFGMKMLNMYANFGIMRLENRHDLIGN